MRANAENGYVSALDVYTGKKGDNVEKGLGSKVVKCLTKELYNTYRHIYYDNFFASVNFLLLICIEPACTAVQHSEPTGRISQQHRKHLQSRG